MIQRKSVFYVLESALKNVKSLKQHCSALIISGASTQDGHLWFQADDSLTKRMKYEILYDDKMRVVTHKGANIQKARYAWVGETFSSVLRLHHK